MMSLHDLAQCLFELVIFLSSLLNIVQLTTQLDNLDQADAIVLAYMVHHLYNIWPGKQATIVLE